MIPSWLAEGQASGETVFPSSRPRPSGFVARNVRGLARLLDERPDRLLRIDPRCALVSLIVFLVCVAFLRTPALSWGAFLCIFLSAFLCGELRSLIGGGKLVLPLALCASGLVMLPVLFNLVSPGEPLVTLARFGSPAHPQTIAVTRRGADLFLTFTGRTAASVSAVLLTATIVPRHRLIQGLSALPIPRIFVMTASLAACYLQLLARLALEMHDGLRSRLLKSPSGSLGRRWTIGILGRLFRHSLETGTELHQAMVARGFTGEVKASAPFRAGKRDVGLTILFMLISLLLVAADRGLS